MAENRPNADQKIYGQIAFGDPAAVFTAIFHVVLGLPGPGELRAPISLKIEYSALVPARPR